MRRGAPSSSWCLGHSTLVCTLPGCRRIGQVHGWLGKCVGGWASAWMAHQVGGCGQCGLPRQGSRPAHLPALPNYRCTSAGGAFFRLLFLIQAHLSRGCFRYFHTLPFLLLRSSLPRWMALAVLASIEVKPPPGLWEEGHMHTFCLWREGGSVGIRGAMGRGRLAPVHLYRVHVLCMHRQGGGNAVSLGCVTPPTARTLACLARHGQRHRGPASRPPSLPQVVYNVYPPRPWASALLLVMHAIVTAATINYTGSCPAAAASDGGGMAPQGTPARAAAAVEQKEEEEEEVPVRRRRPRAAA